MKLVELLARELVEWPENYAHGLLAQSVNGSVSYIINNRTKWTMPTSPSLASDWLTAIVSREDWQAERDRQKGGEWREHRGSDQPVVDGTQIEYMLRNGDIGNWAPETLEWDHTNHAGDIMKYRIISQPQAEEPMKAKFDGVKLEFSRDGVNFSEIGTTSADYIAEIGIEPKWQQSSGPFAWRDTIIHCQAIIEDCEREIQRNVDLLDAEGLYMQLNAKVGMAYAEPVVLPIEEWQIGDILEIFAEEQGHEYEIGTQVKVIRFDRADEDMPVEVECGKGHAYYVNEREAKFIRRP